MVSSQYLIDVTYNAGDVPSDDYPFNLAALQNFKRLKFHPKVTYFIGENGSGKSTLLEAFAVALGFNPEGGTKNFNFETFETEYPLSRYLRLGRGYPYPRDGFFLRAESFFNVATQVDELDLQGWYGGKSLHEQSHGESFLTLMTTRFHGDAIYILDEPEAALSPQRQLAVLSRIHDLVRDSSQFIIATHSPILMAYPDSTIYQCGPDGITEVDYEDTEHYQVARDFLSNRERMLKILLADD
ncbi:MAG TPA: AAA family ATPase [Pyrinomonadaceae bacterium]|nr:AAA family ATPase [Pyrinomonadaceae bacterium]